MIFPWLGFLTPEACQESAVYPYGLYFNLVLKGSALAWKSLMADDYVFGTHWVKFEPFQVAGQLKGCSLVYLAVVADRMYLKGDQVAANRTYR